MSTKEAPKADKSQSNPLSRAAVVALTGGASLVVVSGLAFFGPSGGSSSISAVAPWLLACFSFSHFILSIRWFYGHASLRKRHPVISFVLPFALAALAAWLMLAAGPASLQWTLTAGIAMLHWHFAKQAFGAALWNGGTKVPSRLRASLLISCLAIAAYGFASGQIGRGHFTAFHFYIAKSGVPLWTKTAFLVLASIAIASVLRQGLKARAEGWRMSSALVPVLALFVWLEPSLSVEGLAVAAVFHGLQSLPFLTSRSLVSQGPSTGDTARALATWTGAAVLGWLVLAWIPQQLTTVGSESTMARLPMIWIFVFNLHHFVIDAVGFKRDSIAGIIEEWDIAERHDLRDETAPEGRESDVALSA